MSDFKELELEKDRIAELKVSAGDEPDTVSLHSHGGSSQPNGDSSHPNGDSSQPNGDSSQSNGDSSQSNGDSSQPNADLSQISTPSQSGAGANSGPIEAVRGIRDRMDRQKKPGVPLESELQLEGTSLANLAKPLFVLVFLLILPWVLFSSVSDWSCYQRMRCNALAQTAMRDRNFQLAEADYNAALAALNHAEGDQQRTANRKAYTVERLADVAYMMGNLKVAAERFEQAGDTGFDLSDKVPNLTHAALMQTKLHNFPKAEELLQKAVAVAQSPAAKEQPELKEGALQILAFVYVQEGKYQQALDVVSQLKNVARSTWQKSFSQILAGDAYMGLGQTAKAKAAYEEGYKNYSRDTSWTQDELRAQAFVEYLAGDRANAQATLAKAVNMTEAYNLNGPDAYPPIYDRYSLANDQKTIGSPGK